MGAEPLRWPGHVPDEPALTLDTDGDGLLDTAVTDDGVDLVVLTDLDADGLADQVIRIGPDGVAHLAEAPFPDLPGW